MTQVTSDPFLAQSHDAVGGAPELMGPWQLDRLVGLGLRRDASFPDLGCVTLRGALHFIRYFYPGRYHGADLAINVHGHFGVSDDVFAEVRWWTFAEGRIDATLRSALEAVCSDWKIIADNVLLRIRGEGVNERTIRAALARVADPALWENERLWAEVAETLPSYRLSKVQSLMPDWVSREVVARYLLDMAGAARWLAGYASNGTGAEK